MATTKEQIKNSYPLPIYNYRVSIDGKDIAFSEVSGLNIKYEALIYRNGLSPQEGDTYMPGIRMPINLTLKRGIIKEDDDNQTVQYLYNWIESTNLNETELRDVIISLCDKEGRPSISWQVMGAFPVNLEIPTFDSYDDGIAIESMELMAHTIKMTHP